MIRAAELFRARGLDEPIRPRGLCQSSPAYVMGREDFLYRRGRQRLAGTGDQYAYDCAWAHEEKEMRDCGLGPPAPREWR